MGVDEVVEVAAVVQSGAAVDVITASGPRGG